MLKKRWLVAICAWVLMACPTSVSAANRTEHYSQPIKVMSYNIHFGVGAEGYNLRRTAKVIRQSQADIIGLQEVDVHYSDRSHYEDQIRRLARNLHMHYAYAPIYDFAPTDGSKNRRQSGVAVLSRYPILASHSHLQTRLSTEEPNPSPKQLPGFLETVIQVDNKPVTVYNAHLDYRDDRRIREIQVSEMMKIMAKRPDTQFVLGDFNAAPGQLELAPLFKDYRNTLGSCQHDCYTFPADHPKWQLDYVMVTPQVEVIKASAVPEDKASDHRPVLATVRVPV